MVHKEGGGGLSPDKLICCVTVLLNQRNICNEKADKNPTRESYREGESVSRTSNLLWSRGTICACVSINLDEPEGPDISSLILSDETGS